MKHFVELSQDCIINYRFVEGRKEDGKIDYIDATKKAANGKNVVDNVSVFVKQYDQDGYNGKRFEVWLTKDDILTLAEKIKHIDSAENVTGIATDDLPF